MKRKWQLLSCSCGDVGKKRVSKLKHGFSIKCSDCGITTGYPEETRFR